MDPTSALALTPLEQRLMQQIDRRGLRGFVLVVTLASVALSEAITFPAMLLVDSGPAELAIGMITAFVVPSIVAPLAALFVGRLLQALARASVELRQLARTDALTGVANRRAFAEDASAVWDRRVGRVVVVAMIDIDDFKAVNDRYGHAAGDLALTTLAAGLTGAVCAHTTSGVVGRLGGDEFAVVASVPDEFSARLLGASLDAACDLDPTCPGVTATVGWVIASTDGTIDEALVRADHALYATKLPSSRALPPPTGPIRSTEPIRPSGG